MPIQYPAVLKETSSGGRKAWGANDAILYALGLGMASDPLDRNELPFVHEVDQKVMPTLAARSEEHTSELQSLMRISYAVFCLKKKNTQTHNVHCNTSAPNEHART